MPTIEVYLEDGRVHSYEVENDDKAREHSAAIIKDGWRYNDGRTFEHYPSHRILKVKVTPAPPTKYPAKQRGT